MPLGLDNISPRRYLDIKMQYVTIVKKVLNVVKNSVIENYILII